MVLKCHMVAELFLWGLKSHLFPHCLVNETQLLLEKRVLLESGRLLFLCTACSDMAHRDSGKKKKKKRKRYVGKENGFALNIRIPTNIYIIDTGTCISLVGETQHCNSNAFTELLCPLLYFQGPLGNWYVCFCFFFILGVCPCYR